MLERYARDIEKQRDGQKVALEADQQAFDNLLALASTMSSIAQMGRVSTA